MKRRFADPQQLSIMPFMYSTFKDIGTDLYTKKNFFYINPIQIAVSIRIIDPDNYPDISG